jgi:hypothetical protein
MGILLAALTTRPWISPVFVPCAATRDDTTQTSTVATTTARNGASK